MSNNILHIVFSTMTFTKVYVLLFLYILPLFVLLLPAIFFTLRWKIRTQKVKTKGSKIKVAFFHPYCNAGGGGEKVLWMAVQALQAKYGDKAEFYVYTGDVEATSDEILRKVKKNLNVHVGSNLKFIYLTKRKYVEPHMYPMFTLLGQNLGSVYLGYEAIKQLVPDIFIDTTGYAFTLPLFKYLGGCTTGCYVHYPTITVEMLHRVATRVEMYNNRRMIARNPFFTAAKLIYYKIFAWMYSLAGQCSDVTLVNSTFTMEHLNALWNRPLHLVYPPCEVEHLKTIPRPNKFPKNIRILSLAHFRPEKNHQLLLQTVYELREIVPEEIFCRIKLVLCGGCRNTDDSNRVKDLKDFSKHLSVENYVEFKVNVTYEELLVEFEQAFLGIHSMIDEHFGISVVELMAAGLVTIAHRSGGPLLDIIETSESSRLGFLAVYPDEFAHTIKTILLSNEDEISEIRERARASVDRFSSEKFLEEFTRAVEPLFKLENFSR